MNEPLSKWWERLQFILMFLVLTLVVHHVFSWIQVAMVPIDPYKIPEGRADKVFQSGESNRMNSSPADRLKLFYWLGE